VNPVPHEHPEGGSAHAEWVDRSERGSPFLMRFMARMSLGLGRAPARVILYGIAAYFLAFSAAARRHSREFLALALGRPPTLAEQYRHFLAFASTVHDRVFFVAGRMEPFDVRVHGAEVFDTLPEGTGAFLMGAHLGSFAALRAFGRARTPRRLVMAMLPENARKLQAALSAIDPRASEGILALGRMDSMLKLRDLLDGGALVGVLADRTPGLEAVVRVPFLGRPADFPTGPMRLAAMLRSRVIFMAGLYRGGNRYDIHFETLADFSGAEATSRVERDRRVGEAVARYASRVEHHARADPFNWFNFHDFWAERDAG